MLSLFSKQRKDAFFIFLGLYILFTGLLARWWGIADHFTSLDAAGPLKTIIDFQSLGQWDIFSISKFWTYAPFQFIITQFLIHPELSYHDLLFFGRLPSCFFSSLGLISFFFFRGWFREEESGGKILVLTLISFSLMSIVQAKQSYHYALGITAALWVLLLFLRLSNRPFTLGRGILAAVILFILCSMNYQMLFFLPAFYAALWIHALRSSEERAWKTTARFVVSGILLCAGIFVLWHFFISHQIQQRHDSWAEGPQKQFLLMIPDGYSPVQGLIHATLFYLKQFYLVYQYTLRFATPPFLMSRMLENILFVLFFTGLLSLCFHRQRYKQNLGIFTLVVAVTWAFLIARGQLLLSPTRHQAVLVPLIAWVTGEGILFLSNYLYARFKKFSIEWPGVLLSVFITVVFLVTFPGFMNERKDPFRETEILNRLKEYDVETVLLANAMQITLMKEFRDLYNFHETAIPIWELVTRESSGSGRIAWVSQYFKFDEENFKIVQHGINNYLLIRNAYARKFGGPIKPLIQGSFEDYQILFQEEHPPATTMELNSVFIDVINAYYFYILEFKKPA